MAKKKEDNLTDKIYADILNFILNSEGSVKESLIRKSLNKDQGNMNRYLGKLEEHGYIEKFQESEGQRGYNLWNITKIKNLKNIRDKFPGIQLNKINKSLMIILQEFGYDLNNKWSLQFYLRLFLSKSFFNACIDIGIKTLFERAWKIYLYNEGFKNDWNIKKLINNFYSIYIRDNLGFKTSEETFRERLEMLVPNIDKISEETFMRMFEEKFPGLSKEMSIETFLEIDEEVKRRMKDLSIHSRIFEEYFYEKIEEKFPGFLTKGVPIDKDYEFHRELEHTKNEFSEEILRERIYKKIFEEKFPNWLKEKGVPAETYREIIDKDLTMYKKVTEILSLMKQQQENFKKSSLDLLLEHFFAHDLLIGCATDDEIDFVKIIKENFQRCCDLNKYNKGEGFIELFMYGDLEKESDIIVKYKQPSIFYRPTSEEVYELLKENIWTKRD